MDTKLSHRMFSFFLLFVFIPPAIMVAAVNTTIDDAIDARLKELNKPAVKTIQSPDGDVVDCVLSNLQPAFDDPMLRGKKPLDPPELPKELDTTNISSLGVFKQAWMESGESCPEGSIPILRTTREDLLRANSISSYGKKKVRPSADGATHEHAVGILSGGKYYGSKATVNVWKPYVASPAEFSLAQLWLIAGSYSTELDTIEVGWQVYPQIYGDYRPRLFIYWTDDSYTSTGCYNLKCQGFVQTNNQILIGGALSPVSVYGGQQTSVTIMVWKNPGDGNWWLRVGAQLVGYWPASRFSQLSKYATRLDFGGEVAYTGMQTSTDMGSGRLPNEGFRKAAFFQNLQVVNSANALYSAPAPQLNAAKPKCYGILGGISTSWGRYFFYGGPGKSSICA